MNEGLYTSKHPLLLMIPFSSQVNSSRPWTKYFLSVHSVQKAELGLMETLLVPSPRPCCKGFSGLAREQAPQGKCQDGEIIILWWESQETTISAHPQMLTHPPQLRHGYVTHASQWERERGVSWELLEKTFLLIGDRDMLEETLTSFLLLNVVMWGCEAWSCCSLGKAKRIARVWP